VSIRIADAALQNEHVAETPCAFLNLAFCFMAFSSAPSARRWMAVLRQVLHQSQWGSVDQLADPIEVPRATD
jgi:hypothetical protein